MEIESDRWWRFDEYEIGPVEGFDPPAPPDPLGRTLHVPSDPMTPRLFIRPAPGAALRPTAPSRSYRAATSRAHARPPHLQLVDIVTHLVDEREVVEAHLTEQLRKDVLRWVRRYGLLGILPHELRYARLGSWAVTRAPTAWFEETGVWGDEWEVTPAAEVVKEPVFGGAAVQWSQDGWFDYFPDASPTPWERWAKFPVPLTPEFWRHYAEPLDEFVAAAVQFAQAVMGLGDGLSSRPYREAAVLELEGLLAPVSRTLSLGKAGQIAESWRAPSLLAHLGMHALADATGDRRTIVCACGNVFSSAHHRSKFCSERCANRYRQRRRRQRASIRAPRS